MKRSQPSAKTYQIAMFVLLIRFLTHNDQRVCCRIDLGGQGRLNVLGLDFI